MEVKIQIPTTLNEITLGQYQEFSKLDSKKESDVLLKMVEIFCKVPVEVVRSMKANDIKDICEVINKMFDVEHQLINRFQLGGQDFGFIPDLENISFGEYVDLDTFIGDTDNLHRAMNVLFRPIDLKQSSRYTLKDYDPDTNESAKNYPLDACFGAMVFFYALGKDLSIAILNSSSKQNEENLAQYLGSLQNGDGIIQSMQSLTGILQDLKISLN
jgi:hypothetical protein|tara:strand:- start:1320 stop:1964 length:645 start_codon:yes stop_codon:yes gene_type:complete